MATSLSDIEIDKLYASGGDEGKYSSAYGGTLLPDGTIRKPTYGSPAEADKIMADVKGTAYRPPVSNDLTVDQITSFVQKLRDAGIMNKPTSPADTQVGYVAGDTSEEDRVGNYLKGQFDQEVDTPEQAYRKMLKLYQAEIDATNQIYDQQLNQANIEGRGRLGSSAALMARSGLAGSDFGQAQNESIVGYNADIRKGILAEKQAKIGNIMGTVRKAALDDIAAKNAAKKAGAEKYMEWLKGKAERKSKNAAAAAQMLLDEDIKPDEVKWTEFLKDSGGLTEQEVRAAYAEAKATKEANAAKSALEERKVKVDEEQNRIDEMYKKGMLTTAQYNAETGRINATKKADSKGVPVSEDAIKDLQSQMASRTGTDGYTDSLFYMQKLGEWRSSGGSVEAFLGKFPVSNYLNPADPTVNKMLQAAIKEEQDSGSNFVFDLSGIKIPEGGRGLEEDKNGNGVPDSEE